MWAHLSCARSSSRFHHSSHIKAPLWNSVRNDSFFFSTVDGQEQIIWIDYCTVLQWSKKYGKRHSRHHDPNYFWLWVTLFLIGLAKGCIILACHFLDGLSVGDLGEVASDASCWLVSSQGTFFPILIVHFYFRTSVCKWCIIVSKARGVTSQSEAMRLDRERNGVVDADCFV